MTNPNIRTKAFMCFMVFLSCTAGIAHADTNDVAVANAYYSEAQKAYNEGSWLDARDMASNALNLYVKAGNEEGRLKTMDLLAKIDASLKESADKKYNQAYKDFREGSFNKSIKWASEAKAEYTRINDNPNAEKCDQLIKNAQDSMMAEKVELAKKIFREAQELFEKGDYIHAGDKLEEACPIFNETSYIEGLLDCKSLKDAIASKDALMRGQALELHKKATDAHMKAESTQRFEDYVTAKNLAEQARAIYQKLKDVKGFKECSDIINDCNYKLSSLEQKDKARADNYYNECRNIALRAGGEINEDAKKTYYKNATANCEMAQAIYGHLWSWARDMLNTEKQKLYETEIAKCKSKIDEINTNVENIGTLEKAKDLLKEANRLYTSGECEKARTVALQAKDLYQKIGDAGVYSCISLVDQIDECRKDMAQAETHLKIMAEYYKRADYANATKELIKAETIYKDVRNNDGIKKCAFLRQKITESIKDRSTADKYLFQAKVDFEDKKFEDALANAREAAKTYAKINYDKGTREAASLLSNISREKNTIDKQAQERMMMTLGAVVIGIVAVIGGWFLKKAQKEGAEKKRADEERRRIEDERKRKAEETRLREEKRAKELEMERNKLKAMIADEMKKMEMEKIGKQ